MRINTCTLPVHKGRYKKREFEKSKRARRREIEGRRKERKQRGTQLPG
jgi:hypothetical protein